MSDGPVPPRGPMPPFAIDLHAMPELIWACRRELANVLRREAEAEANPIVARRLREIADRFEAGTG